ncbi:MAG: SRPBCC family protein [Nocardioides sp.]
MGHPRSRHVSVWISRPAAEVYAFAARPENLSQWAGGLAGAVVEWTGSAWATDSPMGAITFTFAPPNELGVLDHDVRLPSGDVVSNPLRVLAYGDASELVFTLRQLPGMSDEDFDRDAAMVAVDLNRLKELLKR